MFGRLPLKFVSQNYAPPALAVTIDHYAGIRRKAGRIGPLRDDDGRATRPLGRHHGYDYGRDGLSWTAWRLLPKSALARQAGHGYSNHHEEPDRRQRADSERYGNAQKTILIYSAIVIVSEAK